ncbi:MAG: peptidyl-prolyl cis-trans isomerase [Holophaga sp.]|nr:peptidyl-prolyl cis-trans isomerase [Holophaga sp.]
METSVRKVLTVLFLALPLLASKPRVEITTTAGAFTVELEPDATPVTVANFMNYVKKGFYPGTIFHRVMKSAPTIIQGGGLTPDLAKKPTDASIKCEADLAKAKGLSNVRGTIAMARESLPDSAKAQFYINVGNNKALDFKARNLADFGYCVFGKVIKGMNVVDKIAAAKTSTQKTMADVPVKPVTITAVKEVQ